MEFKDRLKHLREARGLSAAQLAAQFSKSESAIRMWELGRSKPDVDTLISLASFFSCSIDYIVGISNSRNQQESDLVIQHNNEINDLIKSLSEESLLAFLECVKVILEAFYCIDTAPQHLSTEDRMPNDVRALYKDIIKNTSLLTTIIYYEPNDGDLPITEDVQLQNGIYRLLWDLETSFDKFSYVISNFSGESDNQAKAFSRYYMSLLQKNREKNTSLTDPTD